MRRCILVTGAIAVAVGGLWGCVRSESSRYQRTITGTVPPERSASADVAHEFALTGTDASAISLGATDR